MDDHSHHTGQYEQAAGDGVFGGPGLRLDEAKQRTGGMNVFAEDGKVGSLVTFRGTHEGPLFMFPPSGKQMTLNTLHITHFHDDKIAEHWCWSRWNSFRPWRSIWRWLTPEGSRRV